MDADAEAVTELIVSTYTAAGVPVPRIAHHVCNWIDLGMLFVCRDQGRVWAVVGVHQEPGRPETATVGGLALDLSRQGQGHGRALLLELLEALHAEGITRIEAVTHPRMTRALSLYRSMGAEVRRIGGHWGITGDVAAILRTGGHRTA